MNVEDIQAKQQVVLSALQQEYENLLDENMGKLYNQFVAFITAAGLPLPQVMLVLSLLMQDVTNQASTQYKGI